MKNKDLVVSLIEVATKYAPPIPHELIAARAQAIWEKDGGDSLSNWLKAEADLKADHILDFAIALQKSLSPTMQELSGQLVEMSSEHDHTLADAINSHLRDDIREDYVLVDNLKFYRNYGDRQIVVLEESPRTRTLYMDNRFNRPQIGAFGEGHFGKSDENSEPVSLGLPYVVYVVNTIKNRDSEFSYSSMHLAFSNKPLKNLKQNVNVPLLPNMGSGHATLCCKNLKSSQSTPMEVAQDVITQFWQSQFNYMLFTPKNRDTIKTFEEWAQKTKENPLFVLNIEWPTQSYSLASTLNLNNEGRIAQLQKVIAENKRTYIGEVRRILTDISALQPTEAVV
jgi:hypothetical protein